MASFISKTDAPMGQIAFNPSAVYYYNTVICAEG